jgi:hypothetical protein
MIVTCIHNYACCIRFSRDSSVLLQLSLYDYWFLAHTITPTVMQTARNATDGAIDTKYPTKRISLDYHDELEDSTEHVEQALMRPAGYMVGAYDFPCFLRFPAASLNTPEDPFHRLAELLQSSNRIFVLLGAGLSASSGMETFGPTAKRWRGLSPDYFRATWSLREDLTVMWWFFSDRMKKAQEAEPSRGHQALAHLARQRKDFLAVDVTFDGESRSSVSGV